MPTLWDDSNGDNIFRDSAGESIWLDSEGSDVWLLGEAVADVGRICISVTARTPFAVSTVSLPSAVTTQAECAS